MNFYRDAIAFFGFVVPIIFAAIAVFGAFTVKGKIDDSFKSKTSNFKNFDQNEEIAKGLEEQISEKRKHVEFWEALISQETASAISSNLRSVEEKLPGKEFQTTGQQFPTSTDGFAKASKQDSAQVRLSFRSTFRAMQQALLELETRMPQLQLQDLNMTPGSNSNRLNFEVNYTAWEQ